MRETWGPDQQPRDVLTELVQQVTLNTLDPDEAATVAQELWRVISADGRCVFETNDELALAAASSRARAKLTRELNAGNMHNWVKAHDEEVRSNGSVW